MQQCVYCRQVTLVTNDYYTYNQYGMPQSPTRSYGRSDEYPELPALATSAALGCSLCGMLRGHLQTMLPRWATSRGWLIPEESVDIHIKDFRLSIENHGPGARPNLEQAGPFRITFFVVVPTGPRAALPLPFRIFAKEGSLAANHGNIGRRRPACDPLAESNITKVRQLLADCSASHEACRNESSSYSPSRLLDVGAAQCKDVILVETSAFSTSLHYIALSHTWGPITGLARTTLDTLAAHKRRISFASLPANFRDAATVARAFGIRYLWLDALCIVQDDLRDWALESARMHLIYANSVFTLAATKATSATDGFLQKRPSLDTAALPYEAEGRVGQFFLAVEEGHWLDNDHDKYVESSTWNTRGWTLQERLLSKRILHVTQSFLYLECRCMDWTEDNRPSSAGINRMPWLGVPRDILDPNLTELLPLTMVPGSYPTYYSWYRIVELYSHRYLTNFGDKLPALSGVAHEMAKMTGDEYLAGLWRGHLVLGLQWNTVDAETMPAVSYRAPSWSWAQVDGAITCPNGTADDLVSFSILEATTEPITDDKMGCVRSGILKLRAKIRSISSVVRDGPDENSSHTVFYKGIFVGVGRLDVNHQSLDRAGMSALLISSSRGTDFAAQILSCLLLEATEVASNCYRRLGTMQIYGYGSMSGYGASIARSGRTTFFDDVSDSEISDAS